jgi:hypothetical protein
LLARVSKFSGMANNKVRKNSMKRFYDRVREMNELRELQRQAYNDYSRFVVLTGRRRVGKYGLGDVA